MGATNFAQAPPVSNADITQGPEATTRETQRSRSVSSVFTNVEMPNQVVITNQQTTSPVNNPSQPHYVRRRRQRRANRQTQYSCNMCEESFCRARHLIEHTKAVHGKFKCQTCGQRIASRPNLLRHEIMHSDQRPHKCSICSNDFYRQDHLKRHMDSKHRGYNAELDMVRVDATEVHPNTLARQQL
ncbi:unnamed protein product [Rodentolepis nana]|uniref:C2H2-type domain-containing protein n=1 Tax=Rodentolepis nana TaxID=102285 RepID=A0A0R3U0D8_RODNA|nr:unnamed protein product [Rodentolepis nana]